MKKLNMKLLFSAVLIGISSAACAASHDVAVGASSVNLPVTELKFFDTGLRGVNGSGTLQAAPAHGDLQHGAHGTFIKMPAGFVSDVHIHTGEYWAVVIAGVGANGVPGSMDVPLPAGSYWSQKGGEAHITKCISATECIFFINQTKAFDDIPDAAKK
jgi:beta-alanine degradation protein BauB